MLKVANCETTARVMREEEARSEEVYNRRDVNERNSDLIFKKRIFVATVLVAGLKRRQRELREWPPLLMSKREGSIFFTLNYLFLL